MQFQKISISTPRKFNGNCKGDGVGGFKSTNFLKESMMLNWIDKKKNFIGAKNVFQLGVFNQNAK